MNRLALALDLNVIGKPFRAALPDASRLSVRGVQFDAVGELAPAQLTGTARRELRTLLRSYQLETAAINCPLRYGINVALDLEGRLSRIREAMQLAADLGANHVVVPMPKIPSDLDSPVALLLKDSLQNLGKEGDRIGVLVGLEVGLDSGEAVRDYLNQWDFASLGITYDPANFLLNGFDPLSSLTHLAKKIIYCHARDARRAAVSGGAREVPVGAGDIEWLTMIATLEAIEYRGYLCVEREDVETRYADAAAGIQYLKRYVVAES